MNTEQLTWEELKKESKKMGAIVFDKGSIFFSHLQFDEDGGIYVDPAHYDWEILDESICISSNRTPKEMLAIMKALQ